MQSNRGWTLLMWTLATIGVVTAALLVRSRLQDWTEQQLHQRLVDRIASLREDRAAAEVRSLVELDAEAPAVLVPLLTDKRTSVSTAAKEAIEQLVANWQQAGGHDAAPRIACLASALATTAPRLPKEHIDWARSLATRLLVWPVHDLALSAQIIGDCEIVLRLPLPEHAEVRVAAVERTIEPDEVAVTALAPVISELPSTLPAANTPEPDVVIPRVYGPVEPGRLPDASQERPKRPRQFLPPRAMKIDG